MKNSQGFVFGNYMTIWVFHQIKLNVHINTNNYC